MINLMIESFSGKNRSLPYGMAISELLDKEVGNLKNARKVYLNPPQHINNNMALRIGYKCQKGEWVKARKKRKTREEEDQNQLFEDIPTSSSPHVASQDDLMVHGLAELKLDFSRMESSFLEFREEVREDLQNFHHQQEEMLSQLGRMMQLVTSQFPPPISSSSLPSASAPLSALSSSSSISPDS